MVSPGRAGLAAERALERLNGFARVPGAVSVPFGATWYWAPAACRHRITGSRAHARHTIHALKTVPACLIKDTRITRVFRNLYAIIMATMPIERTLIILAFQSK